MFICLLNQLFSRMKFHFFLSKNVQLALLMINEIKLCLVLTKHCQQLAVPK